MSKFLLVDIGAGTMDILYYDESHPQHYKAVIQSPVQRIANTVEKCPGDLLLTGVEMGGGPITGVLKRRAVHHDVAISVSAAATLNHDLEKVASWGINVLDDRAAEDLKTDHSASHVYLADLDIDRLENLVKGFGVPFSFDAVAVCAQDHGVPPQGVSHLDFRHNMFAGLLDKDPSMHVLMYEKNEIPRNLNRLKAIAETASDIPTKEVYVMDSGMAAILGASMDHAAIAKEKIMILDVATSHTLGAALVKGELAGFFEYHTRDITPERLESLIKDQAEGRLRHEQILVEGGHGAYTRKRVGFKELEAIIATGPKRNMAAATKLDITWGAPMGDNMMTGTVGLLEAIRRRKGLDPLQRWG
jgi:uncharacterized protein (DUF1786 family)